ncbi:LysM peptidoglycan-binding domain-containing protein [Sporosarcina sp. ANT_H38]|uniref:LysM peptidoglycan-binding and 3D domain-containing protein n=1 Tax=Sporosarcina sp. ANT_H38 TaxID=2597358 RepID=UPI0011F18F2D|nr:3D domain-containing protein [Sporosarcina sp. ANT_H38]KAA0966358.1 LysM peptidoglycan-binding domain-containing protein [Sporosarcina sp. ANT_H38]
MKKHIIALAAIATLSVGAGQASASSVHTVESGDTLWSISQEANISVEELQTMNGLKSTIIYPAQKLKVEDQKLKVEDKVGIHVVVKGDTLFKIALNNNLSVDELMNKNGISSDIIHPGDKLIVAGSKTTSAPSSTNNVVNNAVASATKEMTVTATAYTANCEGCTGITAAGIDLLSNPNQKVIAVDPTVIPMGTRVWVEGYGEAIAGDTGGAIKGKKIDVYMENEQDALNWGRKTVTIKILD